MNSIQSESSPGRADAVFSKALELPAGERQSYLATACGGDGALLAEVNALLAAHDSAPTEFLDPVPGSDFPWIRKPLAEREGDSIGSFTLRRQIGEGGFGVVWMAEQTGGISRMVALKILKAGMDTREVLARFEAEQRALAIMDHPNIAKVFEAGATPSGRPYFAMELVKGVPITRFCKERKLDLRGRLEVFRSVCSAVHHAHQKGIIHRDLKPSNVMVTFAADGPVVKVIDFGIAKATHGKLTDKTLFTRFEQFIGTPAYMSPEQAAMSAIDVDTRSDIYSLGILLYELLAGSPPFDQKSLLCAGYDEMRRIIIEYEPPKLSTRATETQAKASAAGGIANPSLVNVKALKGELDWIVMKAIEKDRTRRYETTIAFAQDIGRYLADEPVQAAAPSAAYLFGKFARRNKAAIGMTAAALALLLAGITATTSQSMRATRELNRAIAAEALARQRFKESNEVREQSEKDRERALAALAEAEAAREEAETALSRLHDKMIEQNGFTEVSAQWNLKEWANLNPQHTSLILWAAKNPNAAVHWYHEKTASRELNGAGDEQHRLVFRHLLTGLIQSAPDAALSLYAATPEELKTGPYRDHDPTLLLASKYGQIMISTGDASGVEKLLDASGNRLRERVISRVGYELARGGKLDEGLRFFDEHRPDGRKPSQGEVDTERDAFVDSLASGAYQMNVKQRLDWRIAHSSVVPQSLRLAAEREGAVKTDMSFAVKPAGMEISPEGIEIALTLSPEREDVFVTMEGGKLTGLTDSTGKNLLKHPVGKGNVYLDDGENKGWFFEEGINPGKGDGKTLSCSIHGKFVPDEGANSVTANGLISVAMAGRKTTVRTSLGKMEKGSVFTSDDIQFRVAKLEPSGMARIGKSPEQYRQFVREYPTQLLMKLKPTEGSSVPLTNPRIGNAYLSWRFVDKAGKVHELKSAYPGSVTDRESVLVECEIELYAKEPLSEGRFEVEYWTDFETVRVPIEVKMELPGEGVKSRPDDE